MGSLEGLVEKRTITNSRLSEKSPVTNSQHEQNFPTATMATLPPWVALVIAADAGLKLTLNCASTGEPRVRGRWT